MFVKNVDEYNSNPYIKNYSNYCYSNFTDALLKIRNFPKYYDINKLKQIIVLKRNEKNIRVINYSGESILNVNDILSNVLKMKYVDAIKNYLEKVNVYKIFMENQLIYISNYDFIILLRNEIKLYKSNDSKKLNYYEVRNKDERVNLKNIVLNIKNYDNIKQLINI